MVLIQQQIHWVTGFLSLGSNMNQKSQQNVKKNLFKNQMMLNKARTVEQVAEYDIQQ